MILLSTKLPKTLIVHMVMVVWTGQPFPSIRRGRTWSKRHRRTKRSDSQSLLRIGHLFFLSYTSSHQSKSKAKEGEREGRALRKALRIDGARGNHTKKWENEREGEGGGGLRVTRKNRRRRKGDLPVIPELNYLGSKSKKNLPNTNQCTVGIPIFIKYYPT